MSCTPKHISCGWWDPEDPSEGGFVAGPIDCTLQIKAESRSRINTGDLRLRSVDFGAHTNDIAVKVVIYNTPDPTLGSPHFPDSITTDDLGTDGLETTELVELVVTDWNNDTTYYYARQKTTTGSPTCITHGTNQLQNTLALDSARDVDLPEEDKGNFNTTCRISSFSTDSLSGGEPAAPTPSEYRTGPIYTALFIDTTERDNGTNKSLNANNYDTEPRFGSRYWNGFCWKTLWTGSPLTAVFECAGGSPVDCTGGPEADC